MNPLRPSASEALAAWAALVTADAEQVPRVREPEPPADHYVHTAAHFRAGVRPTPELDALRALAQPSDVWLDIGAGGGRLAIPLARVTHQVVALEPSPAMREQLIGAAEEAGIENVAVRDVRWPDSAWTEPVDVALAAHSLYDIGAIEPFLDAMERHARRLCVALLHPWARGTHLAPLFEAVHGEPMATLPAMREFVALLAARGCTTEVRAAPVPQGPASTPRDVAFEEARRLLWLRAGSPKDQRMRQLMDDWWGEPEGIRVPSAPPYVGVVSWQPRG